MSNKSMRGHSMPKKFLLAIALLASATLNAQSAFNYPGGLAELRVPRSVSEIPESKFGLRDALVIQEDKSWRILIGLDLDLLPGEYVVYFKPGEAGSSGEHHRINVRQMAYPFIRFSESDSSETPNWVANYYEIPILSSIDFSNTQQPVFPFRAPLTGDWIKQFGYQWLDPARQTIVSNNAISLNSSQLASVVAPHNAIISNITMDNDQLATVVLDHGRGLYSVLRGLTDLTVDVGNGVVEGAVLGRLPQSGANQGPSKLVWQVVLNGVPINPQIMLMLDAPETS